MAYRRTFASVVSKASTLKLASEVACGPCSTVTGRFLGRSFVVEAIRRSLIREAASTPLAHRLLVTC